MLQAVSSRAQTIQTIYSFNFTNGANPSGSLTLGNDGNFYGTTSQGGITNSTFPTGMGTVFKVTTNGGLTTLVSFANTNGAYPIAGLTLGNDGNFYGTTQLGGITNTIATSGMGTAFKVTTNGVLTRLVSFNGTNGENPNGLTLGPDGYFYGTTYSGTVFKLTGDGGLTTLAQFSNTNGANPEANMTLGNDGNFYGTTISGGDIYNDGTVFCVTTNGVLTSLASFAYYTNGATPIGSLALGNDGNFYGTAASGGGSNDDGTVFRVTTNGVLTSLVSFNGTNGAVPKAGMTLGSDGNFYGTTANGGQNGTVFCVTPQGVFTTIVSFNFTNGRSPEAALTLGNDGVFYGTTFWGGNWGVGNKYGTIYRLLFPPFIAIQPQNQCVVAGSIVTFSVYSISPQTMSYQWQKNGTNLTDGGYIIGSINNTLTVANAQHSDDANYAVILSNATGVVTSSNATLTVVDPPVITVQPTNLIVFPGTNAAFGVSLTGSSSYFQYQWQFNGTNILNATNASYAISSVAITNAGNYLLVVTNLAGIATSSNAALSVVLSPTSRTNNASSTATFTATAFSSEQLNFQWLKNGTNLTDGGNISGSTNSTLTVANVQDADAAIYSAVVSDATISVTTSNAVLTVVDPPVITQQPTNQIVLGGKTTAFSVSLTGSASYFRYQWQFNGTNIINATNANYLIASATTTNAGNYSLLVTNLAGSVISSNAALSVILSPTSRTNGASSTATFIATAFSPELLNIQWLKNGTNMVNGGNVSGATNSTLTVANIQDADAAVYSAVVSDVTTSVTTSNAVLTINDTLMFATQPQSGTIFFKNVVNRLFHLPFLRIVF